MRILNEQDFELNEEELDLSLGYLKPDKIFVQRHEEQPAQDEVFHYVVKTFYFEDGSKLNIESEDDPHVKIVNNQIGKFEYVDQGEGKQFRGADVHKIVDVEAAEAKEAYDEYEDIKRYVLFTEEELAQQKEEKENAIIKEVFLKTGPARLENTETSLDDIVLLLAEMIGA